MGFSAGSFWTRLPFIYEIFDEKSDNLKYLLSFFNIYFEDNNIAEHSLYCMNQSRALDVKSHNSHI